MEALVIIGNAVERRDIPITFHTVRDNLKIDYSAAQKILGCTNLNSSHLEGTDHFLLTPGAGFTSKTLGGFKIAGHRYYGTGIVLRGSYDLPSACTMSTEDLVKRLA